jgi:hypothetical protein
MRYEAMGFFGPKRSAQKERPGVTQRSAAVIDGCCDLPQVVHCGGRLHTELQPMINTYFEITQYSICAYKRRL